MESRRAGQQTDGAGGRGRLGRLLRLLALLLVVLENDSHRHAELHRVADLGRQSWLVWGEGRRRHCVAARWQACEHACVCVACLKSMIGSVARKTRPA